MKITYETGASQLCDEHREILNAQLDKVDAVMRMPKRKRGTYRDHIFQVDGYDFVLYDGADDNFFSKDAPVYKRRCTVNGGRGKEIWFLANLDAPFPSLYRPYPHERVERVEPSVIGMNVIAVSRSMGYARGIALYSKRQNEPFNDVSLFLENVDDELQQVRSVLERKSWMDFSA